MTSCSAASAPTADTTSRPSEGLSPWMPAGESPSVRAAQPRSSVGVDLAGGGQGGRLGGGSGAGGAIVVAVRVLGPGDLGRMDNCPEDGRSRGAPPWSTVGQLQGSPRRLLAGRYERPTSPALLCNVTRVGAGVDDVGSVCTVAAPTTVAAAGSENTAADGRTVRPECEPPLWCRVPVYPPIRIGPVERLPRRSRKVVTLAVQPGRTSCRRCSAARG